MVVKITPQVMIDGSPVECDPNRFADEPLAIRGFTVNWGRESYITDKGQPSTATITLVDTTGKWPRLIRSNLAIGLESEIWWNTGTGTLGTLFQGRIAHATAEPSQLHTQDHRRAWIVTLTCHDFAADLGNIRPAPGEWPRETYGSRLSRIRGVATDGGAKLKAINTHPRHTNDYVAPLEVKDESVLSLLDSLYTSASNETWTFNNASGRIDQVVRLQAPYTTSLVAYDDDPGAVHITASDITYERVFYPGISIDGCNTTSDSTIETSLESSLNRVEITYKAFELGHEDARKSARRIRPGDSPRVLDFESWLESTPVIEEMTNYVLEKITDEGARPKHPKIVVKKGHYFHNKNEADWFMYSSENIRPAFIMGDLPHAWLMTGGATDYMPVVAPIGGKTEYHPEHGWAFELSVQWIKNAGGSTTPVTWSRLMQRAASGKLNYPPWWPANGIPVPSFEGIGRHTPTRDIRWGDTSDMDYYGFSKAIMWADMIHVDNDNAQVKDVY